jgi:hypothetical protein
VAGLATIKPNTLLPFAVRDAGGYDSFYPRDSAIFLESMINRPPSEDGLTAQVLTGNSLSEPLLDLLAVRYLVGRPGGVVPPGLPVVQDQGLPIYRRDSALPRAYLCSEVKLVKESSQRLKILSEPAFPRAQVALVEVESRDFEDVESGPQGTVSLVADSPNLVTLHCDTSTKQILVLADAWSPGWQVSVNGESRPLYKVNQMFRGVVVGPGESEVRFTFHPPAWTLSLCMMAISLLVCLMLGLGGRK